MDTIFFRPPCFPDCMDWLYGITIRLVPDCPRWLGLLFGYNLILAVLICMNDMHQWAFILPDIAADADSRHGYGPLYYLLALSYGAEFLTVNFWLCYASWKQHVQRSFRLVLPFVCCLFYGGYIIGYAMKIPFCHLSELILTTVLWTLIWLEVVMRIRIIPTNEGYVEFFRQSRLAIQLCDDSGRVVYASRNIDDLPLADMEIQTMPIRGGWVRWYRDVRHLRQQKRKLSSSRRHWNGRTICYCRKKKSGARSFIRKSASVSMPNWSKSSAASGSVLQPI